MGSGSRWICESGDSVKNSPIGNSCESFQIAPSTWRPHAMTHGRLAFTLGTLVVGQVSLGAQAPTMRDSAGVRIVENPARQSFPVNLRLREQASLDVGGLDDDNPDAEFVANQGYLRGVRLSNGGLVAIDVNRVKYFDARGKLIKIAGRDGDGPGEFRYLTSICRTRGDTIVVADRARLGVLDKDGNFVRHIPSTPRALPFDGCFGDGTVLMSSAERNTPTPGNVTRHLFRVRLDGTDVATLGSIVGRGTDMITQAQVTLVASVTRFYYGDGTRTEIPVFQLPAAELKPVLSIRTADRAIPISAAEAEQRMAGTIPNNVSAAERTARMDRMKAIPRAASWPTFDRIHVDPEGNLWVADYLRTWPSPTGYSKFDVNGRLVGRLVVPAPTEDGSFQVISFGVNDVLIRRQDEDGAAHLTVYPIVPVR